MCQTDQNSGSWQSPCCGSFCHKSNMGSCSDRNTGFLWNKGATSCPVWNRRSSRIWEFQGQTWKVLGKPGRLSWPHYSVINNRHFFSGPHLDPKPKWGDGGQGKKWLQSNIYPYGTTEKEVSVYLLENTPAWKSEGFSPSLPLLLTYSGTLGKLPYHPGPHFLHQ